jgi:hypothetical protein
MPVAPFRLEPDEERRLAARITDAEDLQILDADLASPG